MSEELMHRIRRKLAEAFAERWPSSPPMEAVLDDGTGYDGRAGGVTGGLTVYAVRADGERIPLHHEPAGLIRSPEEVDDWIARTLSRLLAGHPGWPRRDG